MALHMKYFGMVAQALGRTEEERHIDGLTDTQALRERLIQEYPALSDIPFKIAVDSTLAQTPATLRDDMEIALLPPYAGG